MTMPSTTSDSRWLPQQKHLKVRIDACRQIMIEAPPPPTHTQRPTTLRGLNSKILNSKNSKRLELSLVCAMANSMHCKNHVHVLNHTNCNSVTHATSPAAVTNRRLKAAINSSRCMQHTQHEQLQTSHSTPSASSTRK